VDFRSAGKRGSIQDAGQQETGHFPVLTEGYPVGFIKIINIEEKEEIYRNTRNKN
jgi:hypothetical protein